MRSRRPAPIRSRFSVVTATPDAATPAGPQQTTRRGVRRVVARFMAVSLALSIVVVAKAETALADVPLDQQQMIYELNRARWNPSRFSAEVAVDLPSTLLPRPPLAVNGALTAAAAFRADDMAQYGYVAHQSPITGEWPNQIARAFGYHLASAYPDGSNTIESLAAGSSLLLKILRSLAASPPHRFHIFGQGGFSEHVEVGAGRSSTDNYWTILTGRTDRSELFVTGVVYSDADGDGRMDPGEGLSDVLVSAGGRSVRTNVGGGYTLPMPAASFVVEVAASGFGTGVGVEPGDYNIGVDFPAGGAPLVLRYDLCDGLEPTILGTEGDDVITGTQGNDVILAGGGDDRVSGLGGDDVICGGPGTDVLDGGPGSNRIFDDGSAPAPSRSEAGIQTLGFPADAGDTVTLVDHRGGWHRLGRDGAGSFDSFMFGNPGDVPFTGDWDCDGVETPGLYRQANGYVYLRNSNNAGVADVEFYFGNTGDIPIPGDFDGDGCDTVSLYRPSMASFFIVNRLGSQASGLGAADYRFVFGNPGDTPFAGDFDGDGFDEVGLHRESTGLVYFVNEVRPGSGGAADREFVFGNPGDKILTGDWDGDGDDTVGLYRPGNGTLYLKLSNASGPADITRYVGSFISASQG